MKIRALSTIVLAGFVFGLLAASPMGGAGSTTVAPATVSATKSSPANGVTATQATTVVIDPAEGGTAPGLAPRIPFNKVPNDQITLPTDGLTGRPAWSGKLTIKFRDELRIRADRVPSGFVRDQGNRSVAQVADALRMLGATAHQLINRSPEDLAALQARAEEKSGKAAADLAGMVSIDVVPDRLLEAARLFNSMDIVEWVSIERNVVLDQTSQSEQMGCGANGPGDGTGVTNCYTTSPDSRCSGLGGGPGCNNTGACNQDPQGPACRYGCNNPACCDAVGAVLPGCKDKQNAQGWDALCATYANILCQGTVYDSLPNVQGNPGGFAPSTPTLYKYDPCFAMRGPVDPPGLYVPGETDVLIQGSVYTPQGVQTVASQLLTYEIGANGTITVDPITRLPNLFIIPYPNNATSDEGKPSTDVPQQALPDPSLEGAYLSISAGCFTEHAASVGCNQVSCCVYVCRVDPSCCVAGWDASCVSLAQTAPGGTLYGSPCTQQGLPQSRFPSAGTTPLLTGGRMVDPLPGNARGYQAYTLAQPILTPTDPLPAGVQYKVLPPTVNTSQVPDPNRTNPDSNLGTLAVLNSGYRGGGLDLQGFEDLAAQLGILPTNIRGNTIKVAVLEFSAFVNHEDLVANVTGEAGQTMLLINSPPIDPEHGTSVCGVIAAADNGIGITGIAPQAKVTFFPIVSREEGARLPNALTNAIIALGEGDVINMSIGLGGSGNGTRGAVTDGMAITSEPTVYTLVQTATQAGITVVCSAGNQSAKVVTVPPGAPAGEDSGAIIVGACWPGWQVGQLSTTTSQPGPYPGFNYCRLAFSNFSDLNAQGSQNKVHVSAWGTGVASTGSGDLFTGTNAPVNSELERNKLRTYTSNFTGTSAAAPMITGLCARLQSLAKQYFGAPVPVADLRRVVSSNVFPQCGQNNASPAFPGYPPPPGTPAVGDITTLGAGGLLADIGGFPNAKTCVSGLVATTYGSQGSATNYELVTGTYIAGSRFSIRQRDRTCLQVNAVSRRGGQIGQGYGTGIIYPLNGYTTDTQLSLVSTQSATAVSKLSLKTCGSVSTSTPAIEVIYFYNFKQRRWVNSAVTYLNRTLPAAESTYSPPGDPRNYVVADGTGCRTYARVYTCGLGSGSYICYHDLLLIDVGTNIFDTGGGNTTGGGGP